MITLSQLSDEMESFAENYILFILLINVCPENSLICISAKNIGLDFVYSSASLTLTMHCFHCDKNVIVYLLIILINSTNVLNGSC